MKQKTQIHVLFLAALLIVLTACTSKAPPLTGEALDTVLAFTETQTDSLMEGLKTGDYAMFSQNFDADMLAAMAETQFESLKADRDATVGLYVSREVYSVTQEGDFYVVVYDAVFEKEEALTMRVVFRVSEPHQISGLWFNK